MDSQFRESATEAQSWAGYGGVPWSQWAVIGSGVFFSCRVQGLRRWDRRCCWPWSLVACCVFSFPLCFAEVGGAFEVRVGRICTPERRSVILWVLKSVG